jgi:very-short-patch-repair endonuclease
MRKADNFNPGQWLIENKLTSQSKLTERKKLTTSEFIEKAQSQKRHQNSDGTPKYTYDKVDYVNSKEKIIITCPKHGDFLQKPNDHLHGYGCPYCGNIIKKTTDEFIRDAQESHKNPDDGTPKYTYDKVDYVNNKTPVIITCPKHGDFLQKPDDHLHGKGCKMCGIESRTKKKSSNTEKFIEDAKKVKVHQNPDGTPKYNYDNVNYINSYTPVIITCPKHGDWGTTTPTNHLTGTGCPICNESKGEKTIYNYLKQEYNYDVVPQHTYKDCTNKDKNKKTCREYEFDFYLPQFNIIIEFDGIQHFKRINRFHKTEEEFQERVEDDLYKVNYCKNNNIKLIRISYNEKDIISQLNKGLSSNEKLWLSDKYPKAGWNK